MILYLARKYFTRVALFTVGLAVLPLIFVRMPLGEAVLSALFWASFFAGAAVYWEFRRRGIWPLFDNLRLSRWWLLSVLVAANLFLATGVRAWLT